MLQSNIKRIMQTKGVTLRGLAEASGVSKQTIVTARQDAGISECRLSTLARIARALEVGTKDLFDEKREP
nr:helix-turn-helix transcriptional regulator [uncultured Desulfovibrio sp.]